MKKKWFGFAIFTLVFSSITTFLYFVALYVSPSIMIPNVSKELMTVAILTGIFIGTAMMYFSIKALYHHGTKVAIIETDLNKESKTKL
uniref:ORF39 n=1 Tax=Nitrosopumilaceae spindle-shaped virus TaxID=3065433 RepID=A0AAT9JAF0_9VIRU